jgi:hypothetical protein
MLTNIRPSAWRLFALASALVTGLAIVLGAMLSDARAQTAPQYTFTKVADSVEDGFDPNSFGCAAINTRGDIAFRAGRLAPDGLIPLTNDGPVRRPERPTSVAAMV